jgi:multimeric flavodoxin WrbA
MKQIIIFGSSRSFGNTRKAVNDIIAQTNIDLVDLNTLDIAPFDYEHRNISDDFIPLIERIITYDKIIIATPVYWYSMSTKVKIFLDRFSDILTIRKDLGRKLRGKKLFVLASFNSSYPMGFETTFSQICEYMKMEYLGSSFIYSGTENLEFLNNNISHIEKAKLALDIS